MSGLSTKHVVLGLMAGRSTYGYRLVHDVSDRLPFLALAESTVYKTLERLENDGWVEEVDERRSGSARRGERRIRYRATEEGNSEFRRWLHEPSRRAVVRDELHAKLALSQPEDLPQLLQAVEGQLAECLEELASLARAPLDAVSTASVPWDVAARMMLDDLRVRSLEGLVDWLSSVAELMEQRIGRSARAQPPGD